MKSKSGSKLRLAQSSSNMLAEVRVRGGLQARSATVKERNFAAGLSSFQHLPEFGIVICVLNSYVCFFLFRASVQQKLA
jgi:hypothetical protein